MPRINSSDKLPISLGPGDFSHPRVPWKTEALLLTNLNAHVGHSRDVVLRIGYQSTGTMVCYHCPRLLGSDALEESHPGTPWQCEGRVCSENLTLWHPMQRVATRKVVAGNDLERRFAQHRCSVQRVEA
ncbi:hypothetical protein PGT21_003907 [Puccinia graminis f. sp. tritici]|uniref:Uncharacterized protein n=1 Tax=Puccinia graminis f. sp. tritici TaxID=56615 RepID=A0A5B0QMT9_PUCGR|nr:hypothetical protein PGT21_003907 [Puccinia graminis f. sp. tritici]